MAAAKSARAAEQQSAAFACHVPENVVWEILTRLPAKSVTRCCAVCRSGAASSPPTTSSSSVTTKPQPLFLPLDHAGEDAGSVLRHYIRFTEGRYINYAPDRDMIIFALHASLDDLLLVSCVDGWYVCNPARRRWAPLPALNYSEVAGLYARGHSGQYGVLYQKGAEGPDADTCYYVLTVGSQEARGIGCPVSPVAPDLEYVGLLETGLEEGLAAADVPRIPHTGVQHGCCTDLDELSRHPREKQAQKLFQMEDKLAMSVAGVGEPRVDLWVLENYQNEMWLRAHRIELPVAQIRSLGYKAPGHEETGGCHGLSHHKGIC